MAAIDDRLACATLTAIAAVLVAVRPRSRVARPLWFALGLAGIVHTLWVCLVSSSVPSANTSHYYLGAKYRLPYVEFYRLIQAARDEPPIGIRDLEQPALLLNTDARARRAYFIDLLREQRIPFDPSASLDALERIARGSGAIRRDSERALRRAMPASRAESFRHDVAIATAAAERRPLTDDFGYNGSPFYGLVRHADPALYVPLSRTSAALGIAWQVLGAILLVWIAGEALGLENHERLAVGALLFASADFTEYVAPGLVFNELWLAIGVAVLAFRRARGVTAGMAIAFAGLIKLFPFVLTLPVAVQFTQRSLRRGRRVATTLAAPWLLRALVSCVVASGLFVLISVGSGRTWTEFFRKLSIEFQADASIVNSVSLAAFLDTFVIKGSPLPQVLAIVALCLLGLLFVEGKEEVRGETLARRALVLISALGWLTHSWLNYYALAPCLLLPWYARRHRVGTTIAILATAVTFLRPSFGEAWLLSHPLYHALKLLPYLLIPAWMLTLELREKLDSVKMRRFLIATAVLVAFAVAIESWRSWTVRQLAVEGRQRLEAGDAGRALECYRRLHVLSPRDGDARMHEAIALAMLGRMTEALPLFANAATLARTDLAPEVNYGRALLIAGRPDEAAVHLERAHDRVPWDTRILELLAEARAGERQSAVADSLLVRAQELDPSDQGLASARLRLSKH